MLGMLGEYALILFAGAIALALGFVFLYAFSRAVGGYGRGNTYEQLQSIYSTRQIARRDEKLNILEMIGSPECPDGSFSPRQNYLWSKYNQLDRMDKQLTGQERNELVEARGYLPDEIADIIEGVGRD